MKNKKQTGKIYFMPRTRIGKWSFWLVILGLLLVYIPYWIAMILQTSSVISLGLLAAALIIIFGVCSVVAIVKYKERAIGLFITGLIGLLGVLFVLADLLMGHD